MTAVITGKVRFFKLSLLSAVACAIGAASCSPQEASAQTLNDMTGCWISLDFDPVSLFTDSTDPKSITVLHQKMLLQFSRMENTEYLVFGYIFEWDQEESMILGPTYQNGVFDPVKMELTFGFPEGSLDHAKLLDDGILQYTHTKAADLSAMSVRKMKRIDCDEAKKKEQALLQRQAELKE